MSPIRRTPLRSADGAGLRVVSLNPRSSWTYRSSEDAAASATERSARGRVRHGNAPLLRALPGANDAETCPPTSRTPDAEEYRLLSRTSAAASPGHWEAGAFPLLHGRIELRTRSPVRTRASTFGSVDNEGPSRTALATAYARAYHQIADQPLILSDPVVARLLGVTADELSESVEPAQDRPGSGVTYRPRRLFFAARARFAEDRVAAAVSAGVRQVVVLGAGLDTFAYRNPHLGLHVFEVDHPATQAWKHERLAAAGIDRPETLSFVPVDFETDSLATRLDSAGFVRTEPALFVWLGVIFYLTPDTARTTLDYIAGQTRPVEVVFDYLQPASTDEDRAQLRERANRVAAAGEPWFSYFTPDGIAAQLRSLGFTDIEDRSAAELITGYLDESAEFEGEPPQALRASRILRASR